MAKKSLMRDRLPDAERETIMRLASATLNERPDAETKDAFSYLHEQRGFSEKMIEQYGLGYVPNRVRNTSGARHELAGRIVIPIIDQYGQAVALSSRDWREGSNRKFWHEKYPKSLYLYGLNIAKPGAIKYNKVIIVEGEFDVISMHQAGFDCTVGTLGTSLQIYQISLLKRYADEIFILFDGDIPGQKAKRRILQLVKEHRLESYDLTFIPITLPNKQDPDEFLRSKGRAALLELMHDCKKLALERTF